MLVLTTRLLILMIVLTWPVAFFYSHSLVVSATVQESGVPRIGIYVVRARRSPDIE